MWVGQRSIDWFFCYLKTQNKSLYKPQQATKKMLKISIFRHTSIQLRSLK